MSSTALILLGAGSSSRFESNVKKQWLYTGDIPLWLHVAENFEKSANFDQIIIVSTTDEIHLMKHFASYTYIEGGNSRQASLKNALEAVTSQYVLVSDIARCCVPSDMIQRILAAKEMGSCIVPVLPVTDTLYLNNAPIDREKVQIIQTPQLSVTHILKRALETETLFTDDSSAIAALGEKIHFVKGSLDAHKLTTIADIQKLPCLKAPSAKTLTGFGIDIHPFEAHKEMFLCGVKIDVDYGFKAHSDGDVAIHALIDALLGASGMGDIGELYPDSDENYAGADSKKLLEDTVNKVKSYGYEIGNIDLCIVAEAPKILPYKEAMRQTLASLLGIRKNFVNIKATTAEKLGFVGRKEGVTVHAVANLTYLNWKKI
ncbi:bifunctional 2-C-methyl-D-erythritol 4-phosphate cytidylyltransferase/2-C-methyl-D-erythritol 2,4-cyclodiphosphate synthase [Sulfurovum sp.]|uniref:bifunctional 2-C-methyl-D-erythritol 4-phosphate cytidylyltransferase/2-C-methyl-D-erythritol 2,4-cyclodiphosphate synthase n=1 Tax=Sulfurovum sp. TaxID=1969726 RepID=UPI002867ED8A|nr:bifunctional 2-C-methyl-D-erythritol 4-phosphate cytidylyltransferase/2-C-methyl-D-erythritol 2,4-cyclodiphosphate synthase [Sulfurovum sp.]